MRRRDWAVLYLGATMLLGLAVARDLDGTVPETVGMMVISPAMVPAALAFEVGCWVVER